MECSKFKLMFKKDVEQYIASLRQLGRGAMDIERGWERLLPVINHLTLPEKGTQRLRVNVIKDMQTFGKGQFENSKRRGIKK